LTVKSGAFCRRCGCVTNLLRENFCGWTLAVFFVYIEAYF